MCMRICKKKIDETQKFDFPVTNITFQSVIACSRNPVISVERGFASGHDATLTTRGTKMDLWATELYSSDVTAYKGLRRTNEVAIKPGDYKVIDV